MSQIIHFAFIDITIQTLHIAFTSIYGNTHNNLMFLIYIEWVSDFFSHLLNYLHLHMS